MKLRAVLVLLLLQGCGCEVIDTGHRGVETNFGKIVGEPLDEGMQYYNPFTHAIVEMNVQEQVYSETTVAYTRDVQQATIHFALNYAPNPKEIHHFYQQYGVDWAQKLVPQVVAGTIKTFLGQYEAVELVAQRDKAVTAMFESIKDQLAPRNVLVTRFEITNVDFNKAFEDAVESKVIAVQRAEESKNKTVQVREQAEQQVISAKAEAESMRIRSQALSENKNLVEYEAVMKWDGKLPQYMMGGASLPFINLHQGKRGE